MRNSKIKKITAVCEKCGWNITIDGNTVTLEHIEAPYCFTADIHDIGGAAYAEYYAFDEDEFCEMWLEAKKQGCKGVPGVRDLLGAADDIIDGLERLMLAKFNKVVAA